MQGNVDRIGSFWLIRMSYLHLVRWHATTSYSCEKERGIKLLLPNISAHCGQRSQIPVRTTFVLTQQMVELNKVSHMLRCACHRSPPASVEPASPNLQVLPATKTNGIYCSDDGKTADRLKRHNRASELDVPSFSPASPQQN